MKPPLNITGVQFQLLDGLNLEIPPLGQEGIKTFTARWSLELS